MTDQTITPASKLRGEVRVPGELEEAARTLVLASLSEGESRLGNVPPAIAPFAETLRHLGVDVKASNSSLTVAGRGLRGLKTPPGLIDATDVGDAGLLLATVLSCQSFASRLRLGGGADRLRAVLPCLQAVGAAAGEEGGGTFTLGGCERVTGTDHVLADLDAWQRQSLLLTGLYAEGHTTVRESLNSRDRADRDLRSRGVEVVGSREDQNVRAMEIEGGQALRPLSLEVTGQMSLALPLIAAALAIKGSDIRIRKVAVRPDNRAFLDLVRQLGGKVELSEEEHGAADLTVCFTRLKATRVAEKRAERLLDHVAMLAVLATQTEGEFIIRDIDVLRQRQGYDFVAHLAAMLRLVEAKVGEYPEGLVIDGGHPLKGAKIETRGDAGMVQAFAVAGMLAHGDTEIDETECLDNVFPDFFDSLATLRERKK